MELEDKLKENGGAKLTVLMRKQISVTMPVVLKKVTSIMERFRRESSKEYLRQRDIRKKVFYFQVREYCENSGLHGVKYLGDCSRAVMERVWWAVAILLSLVGISLLIFRVWSRWTTSPVIVSFAETPTPIWQIPFPTVTVCPQVKYNRSLIDRLGMEKKRENLTDHEVRLLNDLMLVCRDTEVKQYEEGDFPNFTDASSIENIKKLTHGSEIIECHYQYNTSCVKFLQSMVTRDGVCFSFNLMPRKTLYSQDTVQRDTNGSLIEEFWTLENGYIPTAGITDPPLRASGTGFQMALSLLLKTDLQSLDYECRSIQGFKLETEPYLLNGIVIKSIYIIKRRSIVLSSRRVFCAAVCNNAFRNRCKISLSNPAEAPRMFEKYFYIPMTGLTQLVVEPKVMETSESLRSYTPAKRHCFFPSERRLSYFSTYTQSNCDLECLTNITFRQCGCVDFYMPRNSSTLICGLGKTRCIFDAEIKLSEDSMHESIKHITNENTCNCLPECRSIQYNAEVSQGTFEVMEVNRAKNMSSEKYNNFSVNFVYIFFKDSEFYASRRDELYGYADFMANCGGLLGLCCGFSILSLVELVYYFTLRLWINFRRHTNDDRENDLNLSEKEKNSENSEK